MKLLVRGDDYGFTKAVTYGILDAIDNGVLRNTGLFANMPIAPWAVERFGDRRACLGIDFNIVSGPPAADPAAVPALVDDRGEFIRSGVRVRDERYKTEEGRREMFPYDQVYRELRAQYDRFVALTGRKPGYLHGHSLNHEHYREAIGQLSQETGVPYSQDVGERYGFTSVFRLANANPFQFKPGAPVKKEFDPMAQLNKDPLGRFLEYADRFLAYDYVELGGHPGYVDADLLGLTTLSLERVRDHQMMTSPVLRAWVEENGVELVTYADLA